MSARSYSLTGTGSDVDPVTFWCEVPPEFLAELELFDEGSWWSRSLNPGSVRIQLLERGRELDGRRSYRAREVGSFWKHKVNPGIETYYRVSPPWLYMFCTRIPEPAEVADE